MPRPNVLKLSTLTSLLLTSTIVGQAAPSVTLLGMTGKNFSAWGEAMLPIRESSNSMYFTDLQVLGGHNEAGAVSLGGGYRFVKHPNEVWGAYLFADRERSSDYAYYTVISPGIEKLTSTWKYRLNTYAPIGNKKHLISSGWASDFDNYDYLDFAGHSSYDRMTYNYQELSYGADFTTSNRFQESPQWQIDLSPYAFDRPDNSTLLGGKFQLNYYHDDYTSVFVGEAYDNENKYRVYLGVGISFGGRTNANSQLNLMHTPIYRNLDVNTTEDGSPASNYTNYADANTVSQNHIYFIDDNGSNATNPGAGPEDGTYENPYSDLDEINGVTDTSAHFWIANNGTTYATTDTLGLSGTQTIEGRTADFKQAATNNGRPTLDAGSIEVEGNNTISGIKLLNSMGYSAGINIEGGGNATIDHVKVGSQDASSSYEYGVYLEDNSRATITDSNIIGYADPADSGAEAYGIYTDSYTTVNVKNSTISGIALGPNQEAYGIWTDDATLNITNSTINASAEDYASAISLGTTTLTIDNSIVNATSESDDAAAMELYDNLGTTEITNSTFNTTAAQEGAGIYINDGTGKMIIHNNTFNTTANEEATGIDLDSGNLNTVATSNVFNINSNLNDGKTWGIYDENGSVTYDNNTYNLSGKTKHDYEAG